MKCTSPGGMDRRKSSTPHYQTFPTPPPKSRGKPPPSPSGSSCHDALAIQPQDGCEEEHDQHHNSPLPKKQLAILAFIALAEQTALNSIPPYLPEMLSTFPELDIMKIGLYVGMIASSFALAQFGTNFFWGWLSDRVGRKPVVMLGTLLTAACFLAFGFCRTLWQAIIVQVLMGLVNGNQGVISTCLEEISDKSNVRRAFVYLPVIYGIGAVIGPALGGLLVMQQDPFDKGAKNPYPYLLPNIFAAGILFSDLILTGIFLEESLEEAKDMPTLKSRVKDLFNWLWQCIGGARSPTYIPWHRRHSGHRVDGGVEYNSDDDSTEAGGSENQSLLSMPELFPQPGGPGLTSKEILNRNMILLLSTYFMFQLSNISFNTLFPIFSFAPPPTGRGLSPEEIGLSLTFAGVVTIVLHVGVIGKLKEKISNESVYRASLFCLFLAMLIMPWVGYNYSPPLSGLGSARVWLWVEIGSVLLIKTIASVGGLTSALLLITTSAPNDNALGTLNGLAQTLSVVGRVAGPFLSGGLFSIATSVRPKGEALAWGVFGAIAFLGFLASFGIRNVNLESEEWDDEEGTPGEDADEDHDANVGRSSRR